MGTALTAVGIAAATTLATSLFAPDSPKIKLPPAPPPAPTEVDPGVIVARQKSRRQAASLAGATNITGGLTGEAATTKKSLLGV